MNTKRTKRQTDRPPVDPRPGDTPERVGPLHAIAATPTFIARNRMMLTRLAAASCLIWAALAAPSALLTGWGYALSELSGFVLLVLAAIGRIWCHVYISGRKNEVLVTDGPYSAVRNPLYLFNLVAGIGFGLAVEQPLLAFMLFVAFVIFYPTVVAREEADLKRIFGQRYLDYAAMTPRWWPRWGNYREPAQVLIDPSIFSKSIVRSASLILLFLLWEIIEHLRASGVLAPIM